MQEDNEKVIRITNAERIDRILSRIFTAQLDILVRLPGNTNISVRGKARKYDNQSSFPHIEIADFSEQGLNYLTSAQELRVEFVGMPQQLYFITRNLGQDGNAIRVAKPTELVSCDRRTNARTVVRAQLTAFYRPGIWSPRVGDVTAPPVIDGFEEFANFLPLADISPGGFCVVTRFPAIADALENGAIDETGLLYVPMQEPVDTRVQIRWVRRIKEGREDEGVTRQERFYRLGIQFVEPNEFLLMQVKQYIHQLSISEAI